MSFDDDDIANAVEEIEQICKASRSKSQVFTYGSSGYKDSVHHWLLSSCEVAQAAVQPGSPEDLGKILRVLGKRKVHFAVKGGGHASSPKISSTRGIQIYMTRFSWVLYDSAKRTVDVGAGCLWDEVHRALDPHHANIVGSSRREGVGVAGWLLGGGYSLKTNQYGLGIDNITSFQVVLPDGEFLELVDEKNHADLFEALKGGGNNFGIVTQFTLKTHEQSEHTYGGRISLNEVTEHPKWEKAKKAIAKFVNTERRPKAVIVPEFSHRMHHAVLTSSLDIYCIFDGSQQDVKGDDPFQDFVELKPNDFKPDPDRSAHRVMMRPHIELDYIFSQRFSYSPTGSDQGSDSALKNMSGIAEIPYCARFASITVSKYSQNLIDVIGEEAKKPAAKMAAHGGLRVTLELWPFLPTIFDCSTASAWPHPKGDSYSPCIAFFIWESEDESEFWINEMNRTLDAVRRAAIADGCTKATYPIYQNLTLNTTPIQDIFRDNLNKLREIRYKYDPNGVMSNAAGFRIPLPNERLDG